MPESFFKKHQYTFAGVGAIAAVVAGVFTFVGNSSTRNEISDNSGTIIGVGEQVTLESGAVVVNEYDRDSETKKNVKTKLTAAMHECAKLQDVYNNSPMANVQVAIIMPMYKVLDWLDEDVIEVFGVEQVSTVQETLENYVASNAQLLTTRALEIASVDDMERQGMLRKKTKAEHLEDRANSHNNMLRSIQTSSPHLSYDPVLFEFDRDLDDRYDSLKKNIAARIDASCDAVEAMNKAL